jgi:outer membrane protein OmpA-like peptidoglycan-associated protein
MPNLIDSLNCVRVGARFVAAGVCAIAFAHAAFAQTGVLREQDINEQSITNALTPPQPTDGIVTRGFVLQNGHAPGASTAPTAPAKRPAAQMLITFASNSTTLTDSARAALDRVARALQSESLAEYRFRVEGHADPRGSAELNQRLSEQRAQAVVDYLTQQDGIAPERLSAIGKGSSDPLNTRNPAAPENRRVTLVTVVD